MYVGSRTSLNWSQLGQGKVSSSDILISDVIETIIMGMGSDESVLFVDVSSFQDVLVYVPLYMYYAVHVFM